MASKIVVCIEDGRIVPWFSEDAIPSNYVEVPPALVQKYTEGKFANGVALAKAVLAGGIDESVADAPAAEDVKSNKKNKATPTSNKAASGFDGMFD